MTSPIHISHQTLLLPPRKTTRPRACEQKRENDSSGAIAQIIRERKKVQSRRVVVAQTKFKQRERGLVHERRKKKEPFRCTHASLSPSLTHSANTKRAKKKKKKREKRETNHPSSRGAAARAALTRIFFSRDIIRAILSTERGFSSKVSVENPLQNIYPKSERTN